MKYSRCPYCGSNGAYLANFYNKSRGTRYYSVNCPNCLAKGPASDDVLEAGKLYEEVASQFEYSPMGDGSEG